MARNVARVTNASGELAAGILPYFMDGILPLLKVTGVLTVCGRLVGMDGVLSWDGAIHVWGWAAGIWWSCTGGTDALQFIGPEGEGGGGDSWLQLADTICSTISSS